MTTQLLLSPDELNNLVYVAKNKDMLPNNSPEKVKAINFILERVKAIGEPYMIIEVGSGMTDRDKQRILRNMELLWEKHKLFTVSIWLSKSSCPFISIGSKDNSKQ